MLPDGLETLTGLQNLGSVRVLRADGAAGGARDAHGPAGADSARLCTIDGVAGRARDPHGPAEAASGLVLQADVTACGARGSHGPAEAVSERVLRADCAAGGTRGAYGPAGARVDEVPGLAHAAAACGALGARRSAGLLTRPGRRVRAALPCQAGAARRTARGKSSLADSW